MIYVQYSGSKYGSDFTEFPIWIRIQEKVSDPDPATTLQKELRIWIRMKDKVLNLDPACSGSEPYFVKHTWKLSITPLKGTIHAELVCTTNACDSLN